MNRRLLMAHCAALGAGLAALAVPVAWAVVGPRPELVSALPEHRLLGVARLSLYGFKVYDSRLWVPPVFSGDDFASYGFALELDYLREFKSEAIADRSLAEMRRFGSFTDTQASDWRGAMLRVIPDVKKGDRVLGVNRPNEGVTFWVNGKRTGDVPDAEFARLFFGIWLSPKTSQPKMRSSLLAQAS